MPLTHDLSTKHPGWWEGPDWYSRGAGQLVAPRLPPVATNMDLSSGAMPQLPPQLTDQGGSRMDQGVLEFLEFCWCLGDGEGLSCRELICCEGWESCRTSALRTTGEYPSP